MAREVKSGKWCCRRELNSRPLPYQGSALPLSYGSISRFYGKYCVGNQARSRRGPTKTGGGDGLTPGLSIRSVFLFCS